MARRKQSRKRREETIVDLVEAKEQAQDFFERNQRIIFGILGGIALLVAVFFIYRQLFLIPKETEASEQMFQAEFQFQQDSFQQALLNPGGGYSGFLDIIDNYSGTVAANLATYYAGICYLHLGKFEAAISYLEDFKPGGAITPIMKYGSIADAYSELGDLDQAASYYQRAVNSGDNGFLTPYYMKKLGLLYENTGDYEEAIAIYERIRKDFSNSQEGFNIEKYIKRAETFLGES
jgi:tetratricopeptide (TPR) repeat protein